MTWQGTAKYAAFASEHPVPERVMRAVDIAIELDFPLSTHPATGRLAAALASGVTEGIIGETGTGTGVGLAWMHSTAPPTTQLVSIEIDERQATAAAELFADCANVTVLHGDAHDLVDHGPFDMLVLDAGVGRGPLHSLDLVPTQVLKPNGFIFNDDQWPMTQWPPLTFDGEECATRPRWFDHPDLLATEVPVAEGYAVLLARLRPPPA